MNEEKIACERCNKKVDICEECGDEFEVNDSLICSEGHHFCGISDLADFNGVNLDYVNGYVFPQYIGSKVVAIKGDKNIIL